MESPKHAGDVAVAVSKTYGIETMFTLSGGHVFPLYDGAVHEDMRILDVRHEQSAVFAAEATARLTRRPGLAVLTAGPGITNGVSGVATAHFNGSPVVVMGGRAPQSRWGSGALQEMDHPPLFTPITKLAFTGSGPDSIGQDVEMAFRTAIAPHRGPVFLDFHMDHLFAPATPHATETLTPRRWSPTPTRWPASPACSPRPSVRFWSSAPTCGWTAPRRSPAASPRSTACRSSPTARAGASCPPGTNCWSTGPGDGLRPGRPGDRGGHPAGLPARLRLVRRQGRRPAGQGGAPGRRAVPDLHAHEARGRRGGRPLPGLLGLGTACAEAGVSPRATRRG
nr:hypothetical protein GCM10020093_058700 [Planobispora longispora]